MLHSVLIERMKLYISGRQFYWNEEPVKLSEVLERQFDFDFSRQPEPYNDLELSGQTVRENSWHIGRVLYLMEVPYFFLPLRISSKKEQYMGTQGQLYTCHIPKIMDGNHRYMAAVAANWVRVPAVFDCTPIDLINFLTGASDITPE